MRRAYGVSEQSNDLSVHNGAFIISPGGVLLSEGVNNIPLKSHLTHRLYRPTKYVWTEHAERSAIYEAARVGVPLYGATMVAVYAACADCARAIVLTGIKTLVRHIHAYQNIHTAWVDSIKDGDMILREGGVQVINISEKLGVTTRFNEMWIKV